MPVDNLPEEIEYYNNTDELLTEDDIIETDIRIVGWRKKFRVRALTFGQMESINKRSEDAEGKLKHDEWVYWTIVEGVTRPKFKYEQAKKLADSNGAFVQELVDEIWRLGRISKDIWDEFIEQAKRRNKLEKKDFSGEN